MSDNNQSCEHQGVICSHQAWKAHTPTRPEHSDLTATDLCSGHNSSRALAHPLPVPLTGRQAEVRRCSKQGNKINGKQTSLKIHREQSQQYSKASKCPVVTVGS